MVGEERDNRGPPASAGPTFSTANVPTVITGFAHHNWQHLTNNSQLGLMDSDGDNKSVDEDGDENGDEHGDDDVEKISVL